MTVNILQKDNVLLREHAKAIPLEDIGTEKINSLIRDMKEALHSQEDGVAIAAPQIGKLLQMFVISGKVLNIIKGDSESNYPDMVFINPKITNRSREKEEMEEGCLSVRWLYGKVKRSKKVRITAYDENGNKFTKGGSGLMAQIFQHETDHLEGILFTDKATEIEEIPPELKNNDSNYTP